MSTKTKRAFCSIGATILAFAIAIGGTYAYTLFEHKSNFAMKDARYLARLVEEYEDTDDWQVGTTLTKEISVMNMGNTAQFPNTGWGDIYVRAQLKEFMEIKTINYEYYYEGYVKVNPPSGDKAYVRFMIDRKGNFVRIPVVSGTSKADAVKAFINDPSNWTDVIDDTNAATSAFLKNLDESDFVEVQGYYDTAPYYYIKTKAGFPNGQYGAGVVMDKIVSANGIDIPGMKGVTMATNVDYRNYYATHAWHDETDECKYPAHIWDAGDAQLCDFGTHSYVEWNIDPDNYIFYSDWQQNPVVTQKWILDPNTGWAYWGAPIPEFDPANPKANVTSKLLDSIKLTKDPGGEFFYAIHVDLEAYDILELPSDWLIGDAFMTKSKLSFKFSSVTADIAKESTKASPEIRNKDSADVIEYAIDNKKVALVDKDTGELTLVGVGTATVTATVVSGPNAGQEFTFTLTVTNSTPQIPLTIPTVKGDFNLDPYVPNVQIGANNDETAVFSDFMCVEVYYDKTPPTVVTSNSSYHYGYFRLEDIVTDANLADVEIDYATLATLNGGRLNSSNLRRCQDTRAGRGNAEAIEYSFVPDTYAESASISPVYYFEAYIPLMRVVSGVTQTATIKVKFTYGTDDECFTIFSEF